MADRKSRKKNRKDSNKSSSQKKINKTRPEDRNSNSRSDPGTYSRSDQRTNERSSSRGRISTCYQMVVSRITRPFGRGAVANQSERATTAVRNEGRLNNGPPCQPSVPEPKLDITTQNRNGKMAKTHQRELYDAVQDLLSPKKATITSDVPSVKISFSIKFHSNITSVLIEMLNNIPDLHDTRSENDEWLLLRKFLGGGSFGFSRDRAKAGVSSSERNKREENVRRRRRRSNMIMFFAKSSSILPTTMSLCSLLQTRTENAHLSRNDSTMQPLQLSLPEVAEVTTQKTSPKTRAPTRIAKDILPIYSVNRPISKGDPCSWTNVKARNKTVLVNQMTKTKAAQSYRDNKMVQPSLAQMILHSVQSKVLRKRVSAMATKRTVLISAMQKPISNSWPREGPFNFEITRVDCNSFSRDEQDKTYGSETEIKEDKLDKKVLNDIKIWEDIVYDSSIKYKLFDDTAETRKPAARRYQKRINYYSRERLPTIPEEPEDQDNLTQCELARSAVKVDEPTDGASINNSEYGKLSATYERQDHPAFKRERAKEYQEFDKNVPSHLGHIEIPFKDITDVVFEKDEVGEPLILSSGGFGEIYRARLLDNNETIIVKTIEGMDFEEILRETRIQMYLMPGQYVPAIKGIIATQGQLEIMILQQFCAGGRTLYDLIDACMAETLTLLDSHWLQLAYKLVLSYENMHKKGVLHNDIKSDNILVELKPYDARPFLIDFGMATFRKGGRLILPTDIPECGSEEEHLAPEVRHSQRSSPKSDIYTLGKVFHEMAYFCDELSPLSHDMCADNPGDRPTLEEVADELEDIMVEKDL